MAPRYYTHSILSRTVEEVIDYTATLRQCMQDCAAQRQGSCSKCTGGSEAGRALYASFAKVGTHICQRCHLVESSIRFHHGGAYARRTLEPVDNYATSNVDVHPMPNTLQDLKTVSMIYRLAEAAVNGTGANGTESIMHLGHNIDSVCKNPLSYFGTTLSPQQIITLFKEEAKKPQNGANKMQVEKQEQHEKKNSMHEKTQAQHHTELRKHNKKHKSQTECCNNKA